ncbi:hypothetical protein [Thiohalorhabdus sp.]|uniref:hypothetical protein n=1 Tax=Thiohalorhabdus sp. TaxID=3094134 RepID=UPI002FC2C4F5
MTIRSLLGALLGASVTFFSLVGPAAAQAPLWASGKGAWPSSWGYGSNPATTPRLSPNVMGVDSPYRRRLSGIVRDFATNRASLRVELQDKRLQLRSELARARPRRKVVKDLFSDILGLRLEIQQNRLEAMQRFQEALSEVPAEAFLSGRFQR